MNIRLIILVSTLFLAACPKESVTLDDTVIEADFLVFADREVRQCESDGMLPAESAQILIDGGLDVIQTTCGFQTGVEYPTVCGAKTADIIVHQIRSVNLPDAEKLGFQNIITLIDVAAGTSYQLNDC